LSSTWRDNTNDFAAEIEEITSRRHNQVAGIMEIGGNAQELLDIRGAQGQCLGS
jgi:hypothetical protein